MMKWNIDDAYKVIRKDPAIKSIIKHTGKFNPIPNKDLYISLLTSVVSQQLSTKAANTIYGRFENLFPDNYPAPEIVVRLDNEQLRACGLSYAKAGYLKNIADFSLTNTLDYKKLYRKSDEDLISYLTAIKGVGKWTAEMILMFALNRSNVLPLDDMGIQQAIKELYQLNSSGKQLQKEITEIAHSWQPYRSLACRHLWKWRDAK